MSESKNTPNQTPSISNTEILEELRKARNCVSDISCALDFIDCADFVDINGCDMSISRKQMDGLFSLLDGAVNNLKKAKQTVKRYGTIKKNKKRICASIECSLNIISLAVKIEKVRLAEYEEETGKKDSSYQVSLIKVWTAGFLVSLRLAKEHLRDIFYSIEVMREAIMPSPTEGGGNAHDSLH